MCRRRRRCGREFVELFLFKNLTSVATSMEKNFEYLPIEIVWSESACRCHPDVQAEARVCQARRTRLEYDEVITGTTRLIAREPFPTAADPTLQHSLQTYVRNRTHSADKYTGNDPSQTLAVTQSISHSIILFQGQAHIIRNRQRDRRDRQRLLKFHMSNVCLYLLTKWLVL